MDRYETRAGAGEWLDRVYAALPRLLGHTANFDAWLDWQDGENERHGLAVYIGPRRVGALGDEATRAFIPVTNAAAERDELPYTNARLTARTGGYSLELGLPSSPDRQ